MTFLEPWISALGQAVCDASAAILPASTATAVCSTGTWQLGMTMIAVCGTALVWWELRRTRSTHE